MFNFWCNFEALSANAEDFFMIFFICIISFRENVVRKRDMRI